MRHLLLASWIAIMMLVLSCNNTDRSNPAADGGTSAESTKIPLRPAQTATEEKPKTEDRMSPELRRLEQDFLSVIVQQNSQGFLKYVSRSGVYVGTDSPRSSLSEIEAQIANKRGIYCLLFDTRCLRREAAQTLGTAPEKISECSYKDVLSNPEGLTVTTQVYEHEGVKQVGIAAHVMNSRCSGDEILTFHFRREGSGWKLIAIPYV